MFSAENLLMPAILFTAIGVVIGVVVVLIIVDRTRSKSEGKADAQPSSSAAEETPVLPADRYDRIANLYRERHTDRLAVEVDNKIYRNADFLPAHVKKNLDSAAEGLTAWLGKTASPSSPPPISSEPALPSMTAPPPPPSKSEPPSSSSIVSQINEILQEILEESSTPEHKIALTQEPSMGVIVWVDGVKYTGINEVRDEAIRELIKKAVKTWEKKNDLSRRYP